MKAGHVYIESVGLAAPGLADWTAAIEILGKGSPYMPAELPRFSPSLLPPNERRRATTSGRLAFQAAEEAVRRSDIAAKDMGAVFASGSGDTEVLDRMCNVLSTPERQVSPTDFHNSVHNAAAGYWSIATGSRLPSTALSGFDSTFAVGLMEAVTTALAEEIPVLMVAYDMKPPPTLLQVRQITAPFGCALLLTPQERPSSVMSLLINGDVSVPESSMADGALELLRIGNPAARALPLLQLFAQRRGGVVGLRYFEQTLAVELKPC
nr:hypothetical protein Hi04_10k_c5801_00012 [uncultured bacterium]